MGGLGLCVGERAGVFGRESVRPLERERRRAARSLPLSPPSHARPRAPGVGAQARQAATPGTSSPSLSRLPARWQAESGQRGAGWGGAAEKVARAATGPRAMPFANTRLSCSSLPSKRTTASAEAPDATASRAARARVTVFMRVEGEKGGETQKEEKRYG